MAKNMESKIDEKEQTLQIDDNDTERIEINKLKVEYIIHMKIVNYFWRQKAHLKWNLEGDSNSSYFHKMIKGRRKRLYLHRIKGEGNQWIEGEDDISEAAIDYYEKYLLSRISEN